LDGGKLIEDGAPQLLLRRHGVYSALMDRELRLLKEQAA
jgi:ABC-type multidrug transport system fused ATPase/permease subunit